VNIVARSRRYEVSSAPSDYFEGGGTESGGSKFTDECRPNSVAVGFVGRAGGSVDQISLLCSDLYPDGKLGVPTSLTPRGGSGGDSKDSRCKEGVLVGITSHTESHHSRVGQLTGQCASIVSVSASSNHVIESIGGWGWWDGTPYPRACAPGSAITGITGSAADVLKHIGFICRPITSAISSF
jgi:hypothetical protein